MKKITLLGLLTAIFFFTYNRADAHCEVPCGIYHDELRIAMLYEHFTTIEKAMNQIEELSNADDTNYNQIVRWTVTKEDHAREIQHIANQYFITQRVKLPESKDGEEYDKYIKQLTLLHEIIVFAMKSKQTTDVDNVKKLRSSLAAFEEVYFEGKHRHKIDESH